MHTVEGCRAADADADADADALVHVTHTPHTIKWYVYYRLPITHSYHSCTKAKPPIDRSSYRPDHLALLACMYKASMAMGELR